MTKQCIVTGKRVIVGNNVSHSKRRTKRRLHPNLMKKTLVNPATGRNVTVWISTSGLRTLRKWNTEGKKYDLSELKRQCA